MSTMYHHRKHLNHDTQPMTLKTTHSRSQDSIAFFQSQHFEQCSECLFTCDVFLVYANYSTYSIFNVSFYHKYQSVKDRRLAVESSCCLIIFTTKCNIQVYNNVPLYKDQNMKIEENTKRTVTPFTIWQTALLPTSQPRQIHCQAS